VVRQAHHEREETSFSLLVPLTEIMLFSLILSLSKDRSIQ